MLENACVSNDKGNPNNKESDARPSRSKAQSELDDAQDKTIFTEPGAVQFVPEYTDVITVKSLL
jgi:hypothetical protein